MLYTLGEVGVNIYIFAAYITYIIYNIIYIYIHNIYIYIYALDGDVDGVAEGEEGVYIYKYI